MTTAIDAHQVLMTGENSFIRLSHDGGKTMSDRTEPLAGALVSGRGRGTAPLHAGRADGRGGPRLQRRRLGGPLVAAHVSRPCCTRRSPTNRSRYSRRCSRARATPRSTTVETIESDEDVIRMTWYDCLEPFILNAPPGTAGRPLGVLSTFTPARSAQLSVSGRIASGSVWREQRGEHQSTSAVLAWSESWLKPRG